jgi:hypothetical protein
MARVLDAISSHRAGRLSCVEVGEFLGFIERHFRRMRDAFEARGEDALIDRRRGRVSARAADEAEAAWVAEMSRTRYFVVRGKLFHEQIVGMPRASRSTAVYETETGGGGQEAGGACARSQSGLRFDHFQRAAIDGPRV